MNSRDEQFQPELVEEQITYQSIENATPNVRMINDLRKISTDYTRSGERVWSRLAERVAQQNEPPKTLRSLTSERFHTGRSTYMQTDQIPTQQARQPRRNPRRVFALAASLLVAAVLVGMMGTILTLSRNHQNNNLAAGKTATPTIKPTATATPLPAGSVVYTRSSTTGAKLSSSAAWSPDSKRIANVVASLQSLQLQIWDATTGGHLQTIPIPNDLYEILWSPTGKYLALDNLQTIVIVDIQKGSVVNTINFNTTTASRPSVTGQSPLSSLIPHGGGFGFYSVAWTPDGSSLAVAVSHITYGKVELLNPLTSAVQATFSTPTYPIGIAMAFSSDGQYLAVSYPNDSKVVVWKVSTQAVVFQQNDLQAETISWQPGTHNLARKVGFPVSVQLWNIDSKKLVKTYSGVTSFTWSPDGKELATYTTFFDAHMPPHANIKTNQVVIIDANSGAQVALYKSQHPNIFAVSWSPDGRYLASNETADLNSTDNQILIWIA